jgi:hypothetical protein
MSAMRLVADLMLGLGKVIHDYLEPNLQTGEVVPLARSSRIQVR